MEKSKDELAKQLVDREILACQSSLVDTILKYGFESGWMSKELFTIDDIENYYGKKDWTEVRDENLNEYADFIIDELEILGDEYSDEYDEWVKHHKNTQDDLREFWEWLQEYAPFSDEEGEIRMDWEELLQAIELNEDQQEAWIEYAEDNYCDVQDEYSEIYEWWLVTGWVADKLRDKDEAILDAGWTGVWWGRRTTGQAIYLDSVIREIAWELWGDVKEDESEQTQGD